MLSPVFKEFLAQNTEVKIIFVSRQNFKPLFEGIERLDFKGINLEEYKGFWGMRRLYRDLKKEYTFDFVADFHDVIRTKMLDRFFRFSGFKVSVIDKGKKEKEHLTDIWNVEKHALKPNVERYAQVLRNFGFPLNLSFTYPKVITEKKGIGFAPFAQHYGKMLPIEKSFKLAKKLAKRGTLYFFGGGEKEIRILEQWAQEIEGAVNLAGQLNLHEELKVIEGLSVMISMDSANMHLASLMGTRCISIWAATHPYAGFLGYGQNTSDIVQVKDLTCRPCSVFGDKKCFRGDYACLHELDINKILDKIPINQ